MAYISIMANFTNFILKMFLNCLKFKGYILGTNAIHANNFGS